MVVFQQPPNYYSIFDLQAIVDFCSKDRYNKRARIGKKLNCSNSVIPVLKKR